MSQREQEKRPRGRTTGRRASIPTGGVMSLLSGESIPYTVRISARARVLHLVIRQESGLEIVVPRGTRKSQIEEALHQKAAWIQKTLRRLEAPPPLEEGRELAFMGQKCRLHFTANLAATAGPPRVTL